MLPFGRACPPQGHVDAGPAVAGPAIFLLRCDEREVYLDAIRILRGLANAIEYTLKHVLRWRRIKSERPLAEVAVVPLRRIFFAMEIEAGAHEVVDLKGQVLCPGFIDAHVHIES